MKLLSTLFLGLFIGSGIGFYFGAQHTSKTEHPAVSEPAAQFKHPAQPYTNENVALLIQAIQSNKITQAVDGLLYQDFNQDQTQALLGTLDQHLFTLSNSKDWPTLKAWLQELNGTSLVNGLIYRLTAQDLIRQQNYQQALETLFSGLSVASTNEEQRFIREDIHALINQVSDLFFKNELNLSQEYMAEFLTFARQQELEYLPTSLYLAELFQQTGDIDQAIATLSNLPYDEQHTSAVEELRQAIESDKDHQKMLNRGIPLVRHGSQFWVAVNVGNEMDLKLLIDTGASFTSLSEDAVRQLTNQTSSIFDDNKQIRVSTANGSTIARMFTLSSLTIDHAEMKNLAVLEIDMGNARSDGLLGMNFLGQFKFRIDQERNLLFLEPKG